MAGMMAAAPIPITTRQAMSSPAEADMRRQRRAEPEDDQAAGQRPVPADAVAEAAQA